MQTTSISNEPVVGALPGKIIGEVEKLLAIEFCNGEWVDCIVIIICDYTWTGDSVM